MRRYTAPLEYMETMTGSTLVGPPLLPEPGVGDGEGGHRVE